ncbi:hypothetical protein EAL2_c01180 [Peptoclostridium acidaminophilum DSM 3953]|uniref:Uncharacterized protein n=1 Tax=Peptoclostridium acidaminophilum DSM 3953 TaxID=1286171 RepID=W8TGX6_PEPAC|nr:hypothetical protein EAL2_c01180 [Peptoclostridium acidaminophilum DSM 3953]
MYSKNSLPAVRKAVLCPKYSGYKGKMYCGIFKKMLKKIYIGV